MVVLQYETMYFNVQHLPVGEKPAVQGNPPCRLFFPGSRRSGTGLAVHDK